MKYEITIVADTNDGDYITEITVISEDDLKAIKPLIKAIKNFQPYMGKIKGSRLEHLHTWNWPDGEYTYRPDLGGKSVKELYGDSVSEEVFDFFQELVPYGQDGVHTIKSIHSAPAGKKKKLL